MAKKNVGKFVVLAAVTGAIAAGISYFVKYKSFNKELDEEFHEFEGDADEEEFDGTLPHEDETTERSYVTLGEKKAEPAGETSQSDAEAVPDTAEPVAEAAEEATIEEDPLS